MLVELELIDLLVHYHGLEVLVFRVDQHRLANVYGLFEVLLDRLYFLAKAALVNQIIV